MKALKLFAIGTILFLSTIAQAQVYVIKSSPPPWGPAGYSGVRYYYIPGVESYYDIDQSKFIYNDNGVWVRRSSLPAKYRRYNLYKGHKVVMTEYRGNEPFVHFKDHKTKYSKKYRGVPQKTIGNKHANKKGSKH